jgi:ferric-dicitrate binding protein FerR (iron transport regulator)
MEEKITNNDIYLAKWINDEITNEALRNVVSEEDFKRYLKLKAGIHLYETLEIPSENAFAKITAKIKYAQASTTKKKSKVSSLYLKGAIAIAASIALFFSISNYFTNTDVLFTADFGEQKIIALLDNSQVILNAKSEIKYNKKSWKNNREVHLKGEAFFKVQKGKTFTVVTDNGTVTVLGTQFNVNNQTNFFEVICYEGKVKVVNNNKDYILTSNKSIRNSKGVSTENTLELTFDKPTWTRGESNFRSVPLSEVLSALEKQFNIQFYSTNIDDSLIFTGSFDNKNVDLALASVFKTVQVQYKIEGKKVILSK